MKYNEIKELRTKFLIGGFKNKPVWAEINIKEYKGAPVFTASFCEGEAFNVDTIDDNYMYEYWNNYFNNSDAESKLRFLDDGNITLDEAINDAIRDTYDYREIIDCSCTDYEIDIDNITINFETIAFGQHNIRDNKNEPFIYTNGKYVLELLDIWDKYHSKEIDLTTYNKLIDIIDHLKKYDTEKWLINNIIDTEVL